MEQFMINCIEVLRNSNGLDNEALYKNLKKGKYLLNDYYTLDECGNLKKNNVFFHSTHFYGEGVNIQAIVGKNGCGKSTLMDLLFAAANNYGYIIDRNENGEGESHALYIADLYLRLYYTQGANDYVLTLEDQVIYKSDITGILVVDDNVVNQKRLTDESFCYDPNDARVANDSYKGGGLSKENEKDALGKFFYTIVSNYSIHSFIDKNYIAAYYAPYKQGGTVAKRTRGEVAAENKSWIRAIFHKNDGYFRPVVLNPFRDNGIIDVNNEIELSKDRLSSLLVYYKKNGADIFSPYVFKNFSLTFNQKYKKNCFEKLIHSDAFDCFAERRKDDPLFIPTKKMQEQFERNLSLLNEEFFVSEENVFLKKILDTFGLSYKDNDIAKTAYMYLQLKIIKIIRNYDSFNKYTHVVKYDFVTNQFILIPPFIDHLMWQIKNDESHITRKIRRTVNFLALSNESFCNSYNWNECEFFNRFDYINKSIFLRGKNRDDLTIDDVNDCLPPPFFDYELYMDKVLKDGRISDITYRQISSGETQMLQTLSIHAYHISNLLSVPHDRVKYDNINLVFDEVELCFHPEFQRQFTDRLIIMLKTFRDDYKKRGESQSKVWNCFFNVLILTHSPFILSDIQPGRTLFLKENGVPNYSLSKRSTFAGNIGEMFYESMFMENTIGEFAAKQLNDLINTFPSLRKNSTDYHLAKKKIELVSDSILRNLLLEKLEREVQ
ncbi:ATP-binding protein [Fibrobacter sp. UWB7]|uniref:ATP-binding protein n=1 Tax=Fibrobacter sp. UWB7 TaxID=1896206 RepID=UPI0009171723|nr:ATP-binding protein [Fibrobacter sp. UWB7]SHM94476.1 hypothetical protein SAMN05720467_2834 [Fibrobacter sp. UWB7]